MTPFQSLYGYEPPSWKQLATNHIKVASVKDHLDETQKILQLLKENLTIARNRMSGVIIKNTGEQFGGYELNISRFDSRKGLSKIIL